MADFWDQRAREDAFFFVDDREDYKATDLQRFWSRGEEALNHFLDALDLAVAPDDVVVEVGCGVGRLTRVLAPAARKVVALDISDEMLRRARALNPGLANVEWIRSDGVSLRPVADAEVDACISFVVFQHIPDPRVTLGYVREMGRILRPGGWAAFQVSTDPAVHQRRGGLRTLGRTAASLLGRAPRGQRSPAWLGSAVDLDELRRTADAAGLTLERVLHPGKQFCFIRARRTH
jgi:SAM-dependent methyltransferase